MKDYQEFIGQRFGRLVVIKFDRKDKQGVWFLCQCDCGNIKLTTLDRLRYGDTSSCGCLRRELLAKKNHENRKWDIKNKRLMQIWRGMKQRCYSPNSEAYSYYGGKGVKICDEWLDFQVFQDWALSHGYQDNLTIDRHDANKDYCPENCSWETQLTQVNHLSSTKWLTYKGKTQSLADWCRELNLDYFRTKARLNSCGWSVEDAFEQPKYKKE